MSKLFVSFLGTNDYLKCSYQHPERKIFIKTRFVQEAISQFYCADWTKDDRIVVFTTEGAYQNNWLDNGLNNGGGRNNETKEGGLELGLCSSLKGLSLDAEIIQKSIPMGASENEIWETFSLVFEEFRDRDSVILDITHAFRFLPLLATVLLNYAKATKNISVEGIYYGCFEALGSYEKAKVMSLEQRKVPIFDLIKFDELLDWGIAVDRFVSAGDAKAISKLAKDNHYGPIVKETKGQDENARYLRELVSRLQEFTEVMATNRGPQITEASQAVKDILAKENKKDLPKPMLPLMNIIENNLAKFSTDEVNNGLEAAKWCASHELYPQAYTILQETIVSYFVIGIGTNSLLNYDEKRKISSQALHISSMARSETPIPEAKWDEPAQSNKDIVKKLLIICSEKKVLSKRYSTLTDYRNDINHAGFRVNPKPKKATELVSKFNTMLSEIEKSLICDQ